MTVSNNSIRYLRFAAPVVTILAFIMTASVGQNAWAASSLPSEPLVTIGGKSSSGAAELNFPGAVAASPIKPGHIYVADKVNLRVSEFTAWGDFVKAVGWGVADGTSPELQTCTTTCFKGLSGTGAGQFQEVNGITVDGNGDIYVFDVRSLRVQKFSPAGAFLWMAGGEVNKTTGEEICTKAQLEGGNVCGVGIAGTGDGEFNISNITGVRGSYIAAGPDDTIYVGDKERIQAFEPNGAFKADIPLPKPGNPGALAVDPVSGDLYFAFADGFFGGEVIKPDVYRLDATTGEVIDQLKVQRPTGVAVGPEGDVFVIDEWYFEHPKAEVLEFDSSGDEVISVGTNFGSSAVGIALSGVGVNSVGNVYMSTNSSGNSIIQAFGPPPIALEDPPVVPPTISSQYAVSVGRTAATVRAAINPNFWVDTTYYVEYGTEDCEVAACAQQPAAPGAKLTSKVTKTPVTTGGITLPGLQPGVTYHYRFVAQSSGGGPTFGADRTFTTPVAQGAKAGCANEAFRIGAASVLSDCRAYEMVSPVDKAGGDILTLCENSCFPSVLDQAAVAGGRLTYSSFRAFENPESAPYTSQYLATRGRDGWFNESISPPRQGASILRTRSLDTLYKGFTPDLSSGWVLGDTELTLQPGVPAPNLYRRDNASGSYEALVSEASGVFLSELQGFSADGAYAVFRADGRLTPDAPNSPKGTYQTYLSADGELHLISVKPDGAPNSSSSSAGSPGFLVNGREGNVFHALSHGGESVFWTSELGSGSFQLYLRKNPTQLQSPQELGSAAGTGTLAPGSATVTKLKTTSGAFAVGQSIAAIGIQTGTTIAAVGATTLTLSAPATVEKGAVPLSAFSECTDPSLACTVPVSKGAAKFVAASADGAKAIFSETAGDKLLEYDTASETVTPIAGSVRGVMGVSDDASHVYFVSTEALDGGAPAGKPNLYLGENGAVSFIATLSAEDASAEMSSVVSQPILHTSRVTPDGEQAVFMSTAPLTGYDNTDAESGKADAEVFRFDASANGAAGELKCVSCMPSGAAPAGRELVLQQSPRDTWIAAQIPGWPSQIYASRVLSDDGNRLYFNSYDPLVPEDTNAKQDVYQWQAPGKGSCTEASSSFHQSAAGCIDLISSGVSPQDSEFVDASSDGTDVFFSTTAGLLPQDPGQIDIYDARVGGGFPPAPIPLAPCEGEACQPPAVPPPNSPPASLTFTGPGNQKAKKTKPKQKKKKHHKKKHHKKSKQQKKKAKANGRTGR